MSLINITSLTFGYNGSHDNIFENVSFKIDTDWRLGFIGRNGRGKTTFLKLLMGEYEYTGSITASVDFEYFPFEVKDKSKCTEEIIHEICWDFEPWQLNRELSILQLREDILFSTFSTLSNGEQTKILLAALFLRPTGFLLIDEPTNHLDSEGRVIVADYLRGKNGYILVSHDRNFLDSCVNNILSINKQNIELQRGNFSTWWQNKTLSDEFEAAENVKLQKDIKRLSAAAKRTANWSDKVEKSKNKPLSSGLSADKGYVGHMAAKMMARSKSIEGRRESAVEEKSKLLKNIEEAEPLSIKPLQYHSERIAELSGVSIDYGENIVCENLSFRVNKGDRIALCGRNGCGKSSILKLLTGENIPYSGGLFIGGGLTISYVSQDSSFLKGSLKDFALEEKIDESLFKAILRKLDFSRVQFEKQMEDFSAGQKKKVLLAKSLCQQAHLYIWDEPLNYIDVFSRIQLEELLLCHAPTILLVEHDAAFIDRVATQRILF